VADPEGYLKMSNPNAPEIALDKVDSKSWYQRHKVKLAVGAGAISLAAPVAFQQVEEMIDAVVESAHWAAPGMSVAFAAYAGGAALMLAAAGSKIRNPFKIHLEFSRLRKAQGSRTMQAGFLTNAAGAYGLGGIEFAAVLNLPPSSWGLLAIPAADLALTTVRVNGSLSLLKKPGLQHESSGLSTNSNTGEV